MNAVRSIVAGVFCLAAGMSQATPLYQCPLTVSGYAEGKAALADFPVLVRISTAINGFSYGDCAAGGADISFTSEDGETVYPHEVDTWNPNGESLVWVKLPSMAHGTKFLFRWADQNPPANDPKTVWTDYVGVWHFNENGGLSAADSSPNGFHGSVLAEGADAADYTAVTVAGQTVGAGRQCTARSLSFTMPDYSALKVGGNFTASGIFKMEARTAYESFFNKKQSWNVGKGFQCNMQNSDEAFFICGSGSDKTYSNKTLPNVKSNWTHLTLAYNGTSVTVYNKGGTVASFTINDTGDVARDMTVAGFKGIVDEVRVRKGATSAEWVKAEYEVATKSDYLTAGTMEVLSSEGIVVSSDGPRYGVVSPDYGRIAEPKAGTTYDFSCTTATQTLNAAGTTRAVCTGWELRRLADGELIKSSLSEGERQFACSHEYIQDEGVELRWLWTVQHLVTAETATAGGTVAPAAQWIDAGSVATIVPTPDSGCAFYRWSGDLGEASPTANPLQLTVDAPKTVSAAFLQTSFPDYDHVFFVSTGGNDENGGTTLDVAVKTVAKGLELAKASVAEGCTAAVVVTPGTYAISSALAFDKPVAMIGQCDAEGTRPTINGNNKCLCANITCDGVVIRNIRLYNGNHAKGGVVSMTANGSIDNCIIDTGSSGSNCSGGCVYMSKGTISHSVIKNGRTIDGSGNGDGVYMDGGVLEHSLITKNSSSRTETKYGGGVYLKKGLVRNCTIYGNTETRAGGIYVAAGATFVDSIVWGNSVRSDASTGSPNWWMENGAYVTNICTPVAMGVTTGGRALTSYPNFKDAAANDFRLQPGSPCIDAGSLTYPDGTLDLAGNPRTTGTATDLGAYELDANEKAVGIEYSYTGNLPGDTLTFVAQTTGFGEEEVNAYWNFSDVYPTAEAHDAEGLEGTHVLQAGIQSISLTVVSGGQEYHYQVKSGFTVYGMDMKVVDGNPNAKPPYDTWGNAAANIADAVALATDGTVITLSNGTHKLTKSMDFSKAFTVCGITGDPKDVIVNGQGARLCADIKVAGAVIRDIRLYNGYHAKGGVVSMTANALIDHCIIDTGSSDGNMYGGCVYMENGTISRSIVKNGKTLNGSGDGDGIYMTGGVVEHSLIINNKSNWTSGKKGAGIYAKGGLVRNCTIYGNTGSIGAGVYLAGGKMIDSIVWGNKRVDNGATDKDVYGAATLTVTNTWSSAPIGTVVNVKDPDKFYGNPGFVDAANGDFTLGASSKCKDAAWGPATVELDLAGSNRVQGAAMDLGCYEADPNALAVDFGYTQDGELDVATNVFALIVTPEETDLSNATAYWTFDGRTPTVEDHDATGLCVTNVFGAGTHSVGMTAVVNGMTFDPIVKEKLFKVYASLICMDAANVGHSAKPWNDWTNAATNIDEITDYLTSGSVVLLKPGRYPLSKTVNLTTNIMFRGVAADGMSVPAFADRPVVFRKTGAGDFRAFVLNDAMARIEHLAITGFSGYDVGGGYGGTVRVLSGRVADCFLYSTGAASNTRGGALGLSGTSSVAERCVISNCYTTTSSAGYHGGAMAIAGGGRAENCLIVGCRSNGAGGVYMNGGSLVNCIVSGCYTSDGSKILTSYAGGILAEGDAKVYNSVIVGNRNGLSDVTSQVKGTEKCFFNNAMDFAWGKNCVTDDPRFADAAHGDWHIGKDSPLVNAGVNIDYTADSVDFEGNPRIFKFGLKSSKPDIGIYETPWGSPGMLLMVR